MQVNVSVCLISENHWSQWEYVDEEDDVKYYRRDAGLKVALK